MKGNEKICENFFFKEFFNFCLFINSSNEFYCKSGKAQTFDAKFFFTIFVLFTH